MVGVVVVVVGVGVVVVIVVVVGSTNVIRIFAIILSFLFQYNS